MSTNRDDYEGSEAYKDAAVAFGHAAAEFMRIQDAYRGRTIGDTEFLAGRAAYDAASKAFDEAHAAEATAANQA